MQEKPQHMRPTLGICLLALSLPVLGKDPAWLELAPRGRVLARTVVKAECPSITVNGETSKMAPRVAPATSRRSTPPVGQRLVCERDVTAASEVTIGETKMKMPSQTPKRIVVLGDTGCRIKLEADDDDHGKMKVQDCNSAAKWPFQTIAETAAAMKPDLVIHVGDYIYREAPCPTKDQKECGNSPWGNKWQTWDADFFTPAAPLLEAAPWIFIRGNHETCARSGKGWFYYLHPGAYSVDGQCAKYSPPYKVKVGEFEAMVLDSSDAPDAKPSASHVSNFVRDFQLAKAENYSHAWLLSHRPIWAAKEGVKGKRDQFRMLNATLQKAWQAAPIPGIELIVAGHTHLFELLSFKEPFPPQAVIGNGGTKLAHKITTELRGQKIGGATVSNSNSLDDFGFAVMEARTSGGWSLQLHDSTGQKNLRCVIEERQTNCESH